MDITSPQAIGRPGERGHPRPVNAEVGSQDFAALLASVGQVPPPLGQGFQTSAASIRNGGSAATTAAPTSATMAGPPDTLSRLLSVNAAGMAAIPSVAKGPGDSENFDEAFKASDVDGDGALSKDEFVDFERKTNPTGFHLTEADTGRAIDGAYMFGVLDRFRSGHVTRQQAAEFAQTSPDGTFPVRGRP